MIYKYKFTVFTPTFNRAHILHRVYESLKAQTLRDFEWLIVDDGSMDNTKDLVDGKRKPISPFAIITKKIKASILHLTGLCPKWQSLFLTGTAGRMLSTGRMY